MTPLFISGEEHTECLADGTWSNDPLECEEDDPLAKCATPPRGGTNSKKVCNNTVCQLRIPAFI